VVGEEILNHSNIEAVLIKRQPGDSPRTTKPKPWEEFYWGIVLDSAKSALIGPGEFAGSTGQQR